MNQVAMIDTRQAFKNIHKAGFTEEQADALVGEMSGFVASHNADLASKGDLDVGLAEVKYEVENLRVTSKADLDAHRAANKKDITDVKAELKEDIAVVNANVENLRVTSKGDLAEVKAELKEDIAAVDARVADVKLAVVKLDAKIDVVNANLQAMIEKSHRELTVRLGTLIAIAIAAVGLMMKLLS